MKNAVYLVVLLIIVALFGYCASRLECMNCREAQRADTVVIIDTVFIDRPVVRDSIVVKTVTRFFRVADTTCIVLHDTLRVHDSILVEVPITQKTYAGDDYRAWVSGYEPKLDSIEIYRRETTIRPRTKRWSVGIQGGYGLTTQGFAPYIGVGIGYRLPP